MYQLISLYFEVFRYVSKVLFYFRGFHDILRGFIMYQTKFDMCQYSFNDLMTARSLARRPGCPDTVLVLIINHAD